MDVVLGPIVSFLIAPIVALMMQASTGEVKNPPKTPPAKVAPAPQVKPPALPVEYKLREEPQS